MRRLAAVLVGVCAAVPAPALDLDLPLNSRLALERVAQPGVANLPVSGWQDGAVETLRAEGAVTRQAWQVQASGLTTLQLLGPLRAQLLDAGFEVMFECAARACGGFDFRYAIEVLPSPEMHVDLGDFRYLTARRPEGEDAPQYVGLLVSRSTGRGFVQVVLVGPADGAPAAAAAPRARAVSPPVPAVPVPDGAGGADLERQLLSQGHAVLQDLSFQTGSSQLSERDFESLDALAALLEARPEIRVALVGHTDAEGQLAANIALSKKRAAAVQERLRERHGVSSARMVAEGVGFLAPRSSNATEAGRTANRRVEVILLDTP